MGAVQAHMSEARASSAPAAEPIAGQVAGRSMGWFAHPLSVFVAPALVVVGLVLLVVGYVGVANREIDALQIPYLVSGGIGGLFALGLGLGFASVRELRLANERMVDVDRKVSMLGEAIEDALDDLAALKEAQRRAGL
jgi:hypothetical protein